MCGRYAITSAPEAIRQLFGYPEQPNFPPRYNVAPTQPVPIVRTHESRRQFALVRWGLIPSWVKDPRSFSLLINARGESVADKPAFRNAMRRRRCLFPADGFYEWKKSGKTKQPYLLQMADERPFVFAGLWERWSKSQPSIESCTIITTTANTLAADIHDRMPVMLTEAAATLWLDREVKDADSLMPLLVPYPADAMVAYPVSPLVNSPLHDSADCIQPVKSLF